MPQRNVPMARQLNIKISAELHQAIGEAADESRLPMSELVVRFIAQALGRPELGYVPRKPMGRPRKELAGKK